MSTSTAAGSDQLPLEHNITQLVVNESNMLLIAQELGTAIINNIMLKSAVKQLTDANAQLVTHINTYMNVATEQEPKQDN